MSSRVKKILLILLAGVLLFGSSRVQQSMNREREALGLTHAEVLENAPPVLAFTTVALGGFRGLISNGLWMRANALQEDDKFFEAAQLADWITKLEPHFSQVWVHQAWNMAYNISVKFKDYPDRWNWVLRGIELLRDEGLKYNPNDILMYRELGWFFQNKMGANLDDACGYYREEWARLMGAALGGGRPNYDELLNPQTDALKARAKELRERYKLDPAFMKKVDDQWGPLEWRLPEANAIYWASKGLEKAQENIQKVKPDEFIQLRRVIYQSMQLVVLRGRLVPGMVSNTFELNPNLDMVRKANDAYEQAIQEDEKMRDNIKRAHRNLIRQSVYFLYEYNRIQEAQEWFNYLIKNYPNDNLITGDPNSKPGQLTLEQYAVERTQGDVKETSPERITIAVNGTLERSYYYLVSGDDEHAAGSKRLARAVWFSYQSQVPLARLGATGLPPFEEMDHLILSGLLDPQTGWPPEIRAILRSRLGMAPEQIIAPNPSMTNAPPVITTTNLPPTTP